MTQTLGTLTQPYCQVLWGETNLSVYDPGSGQTERMAHSVTVTLSKDKSVPKASFEILANPAGFELFQKLKKEALSETITIEMGYIGGSFIKWAFQFAGMNLTTGMKPALKITAIGVLKGCFTDNKISFTMAEPVKLADFPAFLQKKAGECAKDLKFVFVGQAKEAANTIEIKHNVSQQTPFVTLTSILKRSGMVAQVGDSAMDGSIVISYAPNLNEELKNDPPKLIGDGEQVKPAERSMWVVSPGAIQNIERRQDFSTGQQSTRLASSTTEPISGETNEKNVVQQNSAPQVGASEQQVEAGTLGPNNPGSTGKGTVKPDPEAEKKRAALAAMLQTTMTTDLQFLPRYAAGLRPRDIVTIPSLRKGDDRYIEDYELASVVYKLDKNGGISMGLTGERPFTGEEPMVDDETLKKVRGICDGMESLDDWSRWLWVRNDAGSAPALSS